ncbi:hypothetical protein AK812_SmicGene18371 [Symbiodinium microadriaticum]|uniref:Uncharacterized protein n=1 Tax=Symbiodinium microadriaticum TaxID=2951 RepID=A0A1Q9DVG9_SYMMI|nr:hypothetical protein AK812_SmicGene18371 [Symbiodinium microadriaticum]
MVKSLSSLGPHNKSVIKSYLKMIEQDEPDLGPAPQSVEDVKSREQLINWRIRSRIKMVAPPQPAVERVGSNAAAVQKKPKMAKDAEGKDAKKAAAAPVAKAGRAESSKPGGDSKDTPKAAALEAGRVKHSAEGQTAVQKRPGPPAKDTQVLKKTAAPAAAVPEDSKERAVRAKASASATVQKKPKMAKDAEGDKDAAKASASATVQKKPKMAKDAEGDKDAAKASASAAVQKNPKMAKDAEGDKDAKKEAAVAAVAKAARAESSKPGGDSKEKEKAGTAAVAVSKASKPEVPKDTPKAAAPDAGKPMRTAEGQAVVRKRPVVEEAEAPVKESKAVKKASAAEKDASKPSAEKEAGKKAGATEKEASKPSAEKEAGKKAGAAEKEASKPSTEKAGKNSSAAEPEVGKPSAEQEVEIKKRAAEASTPTRRVRGKKDPEEPARSSRAGKVLTETEKDALRQMSEPSADPELLEKFKLLKDDGEKFTFLKDCLLATGDAAPAVEVKETFKDTTKDLNEDKFITLTEMQLRREFPGEDGQAFIEILKGGQKGVPHPQAPEFKPAFRYKVLKENLNTKVFEKLSESEVQAQMAPDEEGNQKIAKAVHDFGSAMGNSISKPMDSGKITKPKKALTPEQAADKEITKSFKKLLQLPKKMGDLVSELTQVRFTSELCEEITRGLGELESLAAVYDAKISTDAPLDEKLAVLSEMKQELYPFEEMCREAKKRLPSQSKKLRSDPSESEG